jgi:pimeloyl-ACP methyl ester carboxylesterase
VFKGRAVVYEAGRGHPRTLLLVHGLGSNGASDFAEHAAWLARSYHVLAVDLPGFAQSDKSGAAYSPASYAAFLRHVAERFARKPFSLLGHSMGAVVALRYAANYPEDIDRLVVVDAPGILHRAAYTGEFLTQLGIGFLQSRTGGSGAQAGEPFGMLIERLHQILGRAEQTNLDLQLILSIPAMREKLLQNDPLKIAGLAVALEDLSREIPQLKAETLVIWGRLDRIAPLRTGRLLAHLLPRAQLAVIENAAHTPMQEEPARFRELLEPFLRQGLAPAPAKTQPARRGSATCDRRNDLVYEGDYDRLTLQGCRNVRLRAARVRELRVLDSSLIIEDSDIGGASGGLSAANASVAMTNGSIRGPVAITLLASRLDLAGVQVEGRDAAVQAQDSGPAAASSVVFSISRVRSPHTDAAMHGYYAAASGKPL